MSTYGLIPASRDRDGANSPLRRCTRPGVRGSGGRRLMVARRIALKNSDAFVLKRFTKTGIVLALCQAVGLLLCFATWQLNPDGAFAALVSSPSGALGVLVLWLLAFAVANTVLTWLGFPSTAQQAARDV